MAVYVERILKIKLKHAIKIETALFLFSIDMRKQNVP